ncbi:protein-tyrosine phosphatase family protein [Mariniblastus fucicola]|uniref:Cytochrome C n=1 Tax=Mariniblastus fucicola TaxID=980251 RepID=A0A5B9PM53_9BACT|nr:hypothetical protein [Mariniblastus fucicola]QEG23721.1 hypothetical protein MFFC18_36220 [Mariniblastus fucicola]
MNRTLGVIAILAALMVSVVVLVVAPPKKLVHRNDAVSETVFEMVAAEELPNCWKVSDGLYSGGQPEGEAGFAKLTEMGVRTVISVDGAKPEVELAEQHGLRYVHLPHGYDGVSDEHAQKLCKALIELEGPVYIHCHHGHHRSPAAAAMASIGLGNMPKEKGEEFLKLAGTSDRYQGLYQSVAGASEYDEDSLCSLEVEFSPTVPTPPEVQSMVAAEKHFDALKRFSKNKWQQLESHPDLDASHEALLLAEQFAELMRVDSGRGQEYAELLKTSQQNAFQLHTFLYGKTMSAEPISLADKMVTEIGNECRSCHANFRD